MKVSSLGNHEFDQGLKELLRMQNGGCDSNDTAKACKFGTPTQRRDLQVAGRERGRQDHGGSLPSRPIPFRISAARKWRLSARLTVSTTGLVSPDGINDTELFG